MDLTVKPICELLPEKFYIPDYQRGYRWTARQVKDLLNDIANFQRESDNQKKETFYCLQPIVVSRRPDGQWELIDGQQRLTTLYLILKVLKKQAEAMDSSPYHLEYQTRLSSAAFLSDIDCSLADENIDYAHICGAYKTISEWFEPMEGTRKLALLQCILRPNDQGRNVKVIWYELPEDQKPVDVFVRLNMGKIALTNAELIRALFLKSQNFKENEVHLKQLQIAQEWDNIEKEMRSDEFWYFLYGGKKSYSTRIEYLFELITKDMDMSGLLEDDPYRTFIAYNRNFEAEESSGEEPAAELIQRVGATWRKVKQYYMTCEEWFINRTLYHLVGYLITLGKLDLHEVRNMSTRRGKKDFLEVLKNSIFNDLFDADLNEYSNSAERRGMISEALDALIYKNHKPKIRSILLLFNIATLEQNRGSKYRFPFDSYRKEAWDIEHIKSVKSEKPTRTDLQRDWLRVVLKFLTGTDIMEEQASAECDNVELRDEVLSVLKMEPLSLEEFDKVYLLVLDSYGENESDIVDNKIKNLALLDAGTNRGYKNAVFPVKRSHILALDKGGRFSPLCTTNVFLKYYSRKIDDMMFWTESDREDYFSAMVEMLTDFFSADSEVN